MRPGRADPAVPRWRGSPRATRGSALGPRRGAAVTGTSSSTHTSGTVDVAAERRRLEKDLARLRRIGSTEGKLGNDAFLQRRPRTSSTRSAPASSWPPKRSIGSTRVGRPQMTEPEPLDGPLPDEVPTPDEIAALLQVEHLLDQRCLKRNEPSTARSRQLDGDAGLTAAQLSSVHIAARTARRRSRMVDALFTAFSRRTAAPPARICSPR